MSIASNKGKRGRRVESGVESILPSSFDRTEAVVKNGARNLKKTKTS